ncbi:MAG: hypothetical protein CM15mV4_1160 [Caudoviricetes sp.]|nr:MAG: hypothetical protein CM15mV4_1160 [Caudoviricetes sp.]
MTWFVHDYTSPGLFDYNDLFLGGVTLIAAASDGTTDLSQPYIRFRSYFAGQHRICRMIHLVRDLLSVDFTLQANIH